MTDSNPEAAPEEVEEKERRYDLSKLRDIVDMFNDKLPDEKIKGIVANYLEKLIADAKLDKKYRTIILYDDCSHISSIHSDRIYQAISDLEQKKDILLILQSGGGKIEPAYLISKTCKRLCKEKFVISIPRRAKSAATLISLGADELHMGMLSELGPIDPQFGGFPASGLANAMEKIASMSERFPNSSDMFAKYLTDNLNIRDLGYFERINESAVQYAERLLKGKEFPEGWDKDKLADHLTNHYKDHSFVIDSNEATSLLGKSMIRENTVEYDLSNKIYDFLDFLEWVYEAFRNKNLRYVGSIQYGLEVTDQKKK